jgi:hypothetical protein
MDRFSETFPFSSGRLDRDEDGFPTVPDPELQQCQSCGKKISGELKLATWDEGLMVGPCCEVAEPDVPDVPVPAYVYRGVVSAETIAQVCEAFRNLRKTA